jgi:hypothetical protein
VTDRPDDLRFDASLEPDTPGPEATPEQEAFVASLLGSLRADDPAMPDDVVRRLDAVLAQERLAAPAAAGSLAAASADLDADAGAAPASLPDNVSVLPARSERRGPSSRSFKLVTGIAAATVLVAGAAAVSSGVLGGGAGDTSGGSAVAAAVIQDSGTAYSSQSLDTQAERLVAKAYSEGDTGGELAPEATSQASPSTPDPRVTPSTTATAAATEPAPPPVPLTAESLDACIERITEGDGGEPLLVDQGSYDGRAAIVIVLPALDAERAVDVWVVTAPCDAATGDVVDFRRLDAP